MIFSGKVKQRALVDPTALLKVLPEEGHDAWRLDTWRQQYFKVHEDTFCIRAVCEMPSWGGVNASLVKDNLIYDPKLVFEVRNIAEKIALDVGGSITMAALILLPAGCIVTPHVDGPPLDKIHRCHLPLKTNNETLFTIDEEEFQLEFGVVYEINNQLVHSVHNRGLTPRIHLLVDVLPNANI
jgi:hypothetical protein